MRRMHPFRFLNADLSKFPLDMTAWSSNHGCKRLQTTINHNNIGLDEIGVN